MEYRKDVFKKQIVCTGCGAVVGDTELHDKFHEALQRTASEADRASAWTTPLGGGRSIPPSHRTEYEGTINDSGTWFGDPIG